MSAVEDHDDHGSNGVSTTNTSTNNQLEDILKQKNQKKGFTKTFSFGTTNNENAIRFAAGSYDGERSGEPDLEKESLIPKDKTDIVGAGSVKTFFTIVKSFVGTGILFLPDAFNDGGLFFSIAFLAFIALVTLWCMLLLVSCWEQQRGTFGDIAERAFGKKGKIVVDSFLVLAQLSFGCVYMVFIAETVLQVAGIDRKYLPYAILLEIPLLTPLVWIRHVYKLSLANFIGIMCIIFGALYIIYYDIFTLVENGGAEYMEPWISKDVALFLGTAIFTFEGIGTVIPIQQSMKEKHKFRKLLTAAIICILFALTTFAILGYAAFGTDVQGPITLDLPEDDVFVKIVLSLYAVAVLFSYPLIVFPAVEILSKLAFKEGPVTTKRKWLKNLFRFCLVCLTAGVAIGGGDDFSKFVSLVGGFACAPLGLIFPPLFHYKLVATTQRERVMDIALCLIGTALGVFATIWAAYSWAISG